MRQIGTIPTEEDANRFRAFLLTQSIDNMVEQAGDGWAVWVSNDDQLERAGIELEKFRTTPQDVRYVAAQAVSTQILAEQQENAERRRLNFVDVRTQSSRSKSWNVPITMLLFGISVMVAIVTRVWDTPERFIDHSPLENLLRIAPIDASGRYEYLHAITHRYEVWRLVTPIFLHMTVLHIIFNMLWLLDLGPLIESRKGPVFFTFLVLAIAIGSNLSQYYAYGPNFGGMSGVVYGLFGYAWVKGRCDPASQIGVRQETAAMMIVWLLLCMTGLLGPIANTAHVVGLIIGAAFGYAPTLIKQLKKA